MKWPLLPLLLGIVAPASAITPTPWLSKPCGLEPINRFGYRYVHCQDTTDSRSLNRLLALHLDHSPEFDKYRLYRKLEKPFLVGTAISTLVFGVDIMASKYSRALCVDSFNPNCGTRSLTNLLPWQAYVAALGVSVPLCVVFSGKRVKYQDLLVAGYNRKIGNVP